MQSIVCIKCVSSSYVEKTAADWLDGCKVSPLLSLERGAVLLGSFFFGGKWKCLQVKVKVSPTSASLSRTRRRTSPFIFSGESDCWVHVNGKWWHFWQFLTTSTTTVSFRFQWNVNSCDVYFWKHAYLGSLSKSLFAGWTSCIRIDGAICQMGRVAAALEIKNP